MPEQPAKKSRVKSSRATQLQDPERRALNPYAELRCKTNFSFLRGASHPDELVDQAVALGYAALAITDIDSLAGVVRFHVAAKLQKFKVIIGAELHPIDAPPICLYATDRAAYGRLSRIITRGRLRCEKGKCEVHFADIAELAEGLIGMIVDCRPALDATDRCQGFPISDSRLKRTPPRESEIGNRQSAICSYREAFADRLYLGVSLHDGPDDQRHLAECMELSRATCVPLVANNDVHYHEPQRRFLQDVLTCIREKCTLDDAGTRLLANAERYLKPINRLVRQFAACPDAIARTVEIADRCTFNLDELRYEYPEELCPPDRTPMEYLAELTWQGARERFQISDFRFQIDDAAASPDGSETLDTIQLRQGQVGNPGHDTAASRAGRKSAIPPKLRSLLEHELTLIEQLRYEAYFLTVWDLVRFARSRGILCQGRGSAANSAVCYCLGVTSVDPERIDLLFERFVSRERNEPPDIDVDFEHERREEVFQYIYEKYGRERAGITAEVITYRPRSAVRDVGKALGLSLDRVDVLAKKLEWWGDSALPEDRVREAGLDPNQRTVQMLIRLCTQIMGFPRHLSQHVGGFVMTQGPLCELVPLENGAMPGRTFIEWDKDDIDGLGILKVDCLALGMMTAISKCFKLLERAEIREQNFRFPISDFRFAVERPDQSEIGNRQSTITPRPRSLADVPPEDPAVYDMICAADTVGVFQIESRAQMSMLPRLRPRKFYDLVIEVAIVRPGPIQGGMVHPYLRRRNGEEEVSYPSPAIEAVLAKTLGVPLFQEQAMRLAVVAAGFTPGEADQLRRAMGAWRRSGVIEKFRTKLLNGMKANGLPESFAQRCFEQISGFGEYGFPESHAASFALLVYVSAWLKRYYPGEFCAALINSQPMGFYQPAQLVRDAVQHGVEVRGVDVNCSDYDCTMEWPISDFRLPIDREASRPIGNRKPEMGELRWDENPLSSPFSEGIPSHEPLPADTFAGRDSREGGCEKGFSHQHDGFSHQHDGFSHQHDGFSHQHVGNRKSEIDNGRAVRLGFRLIKGLSAEKVEPIVRARRAGGPFRSVADLVRRSGASRALLAKLAAADAFRSLGLDRRAALWQVLAVEDQQLPLLGDLERCEAPAPLPPQSLTEQVIHDYDTVGLSLTAHPMSLLRTELDAMNAVKAETLYRLRQGTFVRVAGLVLIRQRPSTAGGILFVTLEDETGVANLIVRPQVYERFRAALRGAVALVVDGRIERQGEVVHVQITQAVDLSGHWEQLDSRSRDFH